MEDLDDITSSSEFESLFIQEDVVQDKILMEQRVQGNTAQPGHTFTATRLNDSSVVQPYLQNMNDLLKSCEETIGVPFGSRFSASFTDTRPTKPTHDQSENEGSTDRSGETSSQTYPPTNYIDTHVDRYEPERPPAQPHSRGTGSAITCGLTLGISDQTQMPLTAAGTKLSATMMDYEDQLLGMLAMLESCMEDTSMDFEPRGWATDVSQEYVHISKNLSLQKCPTPTPGQLTRSEKEPVPCDAWVADCLEGENICEERKRGPAAAAIGSMESIFHSSDNRVFPVESLGIEREVNYKTSPSVIKSHVSSSGQSMPLEDTEDEQKHCDETTTEYMTTSKGTADTEMDHTAEETETKSEGPDTRSSISELEALGSQLEECIEEIQRLEKKRTELLTEVLKLRGQENQEEADKSNEEETETKVAELMEVLKREAEGRSQERQREIQSLREERVVEEKRMWQVNLERQALQEEIRRLKRRLFTTARDCAHSQASLNAQKHQMDLLKRDEESLQSLVTQLTEENSQLRSAQQQQLSGLKAALQAQRFSQSFSKTSNSQEELTECRRHSCGDIQQYLQGGLKALEDRYEPILLALLKRRESTAGALPKANEQAQELRAKLGPLRDESQKLKLQRSCLEEKLKLILIQRRENVERYKETVYGLEENSRELKTELKILMRKIREMEELKDSLAKQLPIFRATFGGRNMLDNKDKT
ncbi:syncoilin [Thalassophryne amazonica]|uniref:syncoilin n=1 Tax=Thalassophryne amazonica TaxID=390379 RepID=UPI001470EEB6|nr:syncoilin [Thalassophryne amazonica]